MACAGIGCFPGGATMRPCSSHILLQKSLHREKLALIITKTAYGPKRKQLHKFVLGRKIVAKLDSASFQAKKDTVWGQEVFVFRYRWWPFVVLNKVQMPLKSKYLTFPFLFDTSAKQWKKQPLTRSHRCRRFQRSRELKIETKPREASDRHHQWPSGGSPEWKIKIQ